MECDNHATSAPTNSPARDRHGAKLERWFCALSRLRLCIHARRHATDELESRHVRV